MGFVENQAENNDEDYTVKRSSTSATSPPPKAATDGVGWLDKIVTWVAFD